MPQPLPNDARDLLLGTTNDLVIGTDLSFSRGIAAVTQGCRIAIQMFQNEWFLNLDAGIPYWDQILGQKPDRAVAAAQIALRRNLLAVPGVLAITTLNCVYDGSTRGLTITWAVRTATGDTPPDTIALNTSGAISTSLAGGAGL